MPKLFESDTPAGMLKLLKKEIINPIVQKVILHDLNGKYCINCHGLSGITELNLYDNEQLIAKVTCGDGHLSISIFTEKSVAFQGEIAAKGFSVQSRGAVEFSSSISVEYVNVEADTVIFDGTVSCIAGIIVEAKKKVIFNSKLSTEEFVAVAEDVHLKAKVTAESEISLQASGSLIIENGIKSKKQIKCKAKEISLSGNIAARLIEIKAKSTIRNQSAIQVIDKLTVKAQAFHHLGIIHSHKNCEMQVSEKIIFSEGSRTEVKNKFVIKAQQCAIYGDAIIENECKIDTKELHTGSEFRCLGLFHINTQDWFCYKKSNIYFLHSASGKRSDIKIERKLKCESQSTFVLESTPEFVELMRNKKMNKPPIDLFAKRSEVAGKFRLHCTKFSDGVFIIKNNAFVSVERSLLKLQTVLISGELICGQAQLDVEKISSEQNSNIQFFQVTIAKSKEFITRGKCTFDDVDLKSDQVAISGELHIYRSKFKANDIKLHSCKKSEAVALKIDSKKLILDSDQHEPFSLTDLKAGTESLNTKGHVILDFTHITTQQDSVSTNDGILILNNSIIESRGQFVNSKDASITLKTVRHPEMDRSQKYAVLLTNRFDNSGEIELHDGQVTAEIFCHVGKTIKIIQSIFVVQNNFYITNNASLAFDNDSVLYGENLNLVLKKANITFQGSSQFKIGKFYVLNEAEVFTRDTVGEVGRELILFGKANLEKSSVTAKHIDVIGELSSQMSAVKSETSDISGKVTLLKSQLEVINQLLVRQRGQVYLTDSNITSKKMEHHGYLKVDFSADPQKSNQQEKQANEKKSDEATPAKTLTLDQLQTSYASRIEGSHLAVAIKSWTHQGTLDLTGSLFARGDHFLNEGSIRVIDQIDLGFGVLCNSGSMLAKQISLKAGMLCNLYGYMSADSIQSSSIAMLNAGIISAHQQQHNSVLFLNYGISLPSFPSGPKMFLSKDYLISAARIGSCSLLPEFSQAIDFVWSIPGAYYGGKDILTKLYHASRDKKPLPPIYDIAGSVSQVAHFGVSAYHVCKRMSEYKNYLIKKFDEDPKNSDQIKWDKLTRTERSKRLFYTFQDDFSLRVKKTRSMKSESSEQASQSATTGTSPDDYTHQALKPSVYKQAIRPIFALLAPSYSVQGLCSSNNGFVFSGNIHEMSIYSHNLFSQIALDGIRVTSKYQTNEGALFGIKGSVHLTGSHFSNSGVAAGGEGVVVHFDEIDLTSDSQQEYRDWRIESTILNVQEGRTFIKSHVKTKNFNTFGRTRVIFTDGTIVEAEKSVLDCPTAFTQKSRLKSDVLTQSASLMIDDVSELFVNSQTLKSGAVLKIKNQSRAAIQLLKAESDSQLEIERVEADIKHVEGKEVFVPKVFVGKLDLESGARAEVKDHSAAEITSQHLSSGSSLLVADHSGLSGIDMTQEGSVDISQDSILALSGHHEVKGGAEFKVEASSKAIIHTQTAKNGSKVVAHDQSVIEIKQKGGLIIEEGADYQARGTELQAQEAKKQVEQLKQLELQIENSQCKFKDELQNKILELKKLELQLSTISKQASDIQVAINNNNLKMKPQQPRVAKLSKKECTKCRDKKILKLKAENKQLNQKLASLLTQEQQQRSTFDLKHKSYQQNSDNAKRHIDQLVQQYQAMSELHAKQVNSMIICDGLDLKGKMKIADGSQLTDLSEVGISESGELSFENAKLSADALRSQGSTRFLGSLAVCNKAAVFSKASRNYMQDATLHAKSIQDQSQSSYRGSARFLADDDYRHSGVISLLRGSAEPSHLFVSAKRGYLTGGASIPRATFHIDQLENPSAFALGQRPYQGYQFSQHLEFVTKDVLTLTGTNIRQCDLSLSGTSIVFDTPYSNPQYKLALTSTVGDISFKQSVSAQDLTVDSARDVLNFPGIHVGAAYRTFVSAARNVENFAGQFSAGDFCFISAGSDVINRCQEISTKSKNDPTKKYSPASLKGGSGSSSQGIGLYVDAGGRLLIDGSLISSRGDNYLFAVKGIELLAKHHHYVSKDYTQKGWLGFSEKHVYETATKVHGSQIVSEYGENVAFSQQGSITGTAAQFFSVNGTHLYADKQIKLYSLVTSNKRHETKSSCWGLSESSHHLKFEEAAPTIFLDGGVSTLHAHKGDLIGRGVEFLGKGDLYLYSGQKIRLSRDILNHSFRTKNRSLFASFFGTNAFHTFTSGGSAWDALMSEDPTLSKMGSLARSKTPASALVRTWNLGVDTFQSASSIAKGLNNNDLSGALMQRYGLGDANGFHPSFTFGIQWGKSSGRSQTLGPGSIDKSGRVSLHSRDRIAFEQGFDLHAQSLILRTKFLELSAAKLQSSVNIENNLLSMGMSGRTPYVAVGQSHGKMKSKTIKNSQIFVDRELYVDADTAELTGAIMQVGSISGRIKRLKIKSLQDTATEESSTMHLSSLGQVAASRKRSSHAIVRTPSGIHVKEAINPHAQDFFVDSFEGEGGGVTSDKSVSPFAHKSKIKVIKDRVKLHGFGLSSNLTDLLRILVGNPSQSESEMAPGVTMVSLYLPSLFGEDHLDIPVMNRAYLNSSLENMKEIFSRIIPHQRELTESLPAVIEVVPIPDASLYPASVQSNEEKSVITYTSSAAPSPQQNRDAIQPVLAELSTADPVASMTVHNEEHSKQDQIVLSSEQKSPQKDRIEKPGFKAKTHDVRVGSKKGGFFDINTGRFINGEGVAKKIGEANQQKKWISHDLKIQYKMDFLEPQQTIYYQLGDANSLMNPCLLSEKSCYAVFDLDPTSKLFHSKFNLVLDMRCNLLSGAPVLFDTVQLSYALDAGSLHSALKSSFSNKRKLKAELSGELGVLGPNAGASLDLPEITLLGLSFQFEGSGRVGCGAKAALGAGITVDKTKLKIRPYFKIGAFFGLGGETSTKLNVGIDTGFFKRRDEIYNKLAERPETKQTLAKLKNELGKCINKKSTTLWESVVNGLWMRELIGNIEQVESVMHAEALMTAICPTVKK